MNRVLCALLSVAMYLASVGPAAAQSATAHAQSLFDEGRSLLEAGKIAQACVAFESSQKLEPAISTLLNLADCREQNRQLATAWGNFVEANRVARVARNDKLARVAARHAERLKPRLSQLTIVVPAAHQVAGLQLLRGNEPINPAAWNHTLPVDGGPYQLTARAPGRQPWTTTIEIKVEGDEQTIEVPTLLSSGERTPATAASSPSMASDSAPVTVTGMARPQRRSRALPLALGAGSLALAAGAIAFKVSGDSFYDRAKDATVQTEQDAAYESANTRRHIALGLGGAAIACAGTAIYLYVRHRAEPSPASTTLMPVASPHLAGVALVGGW